MKPTAASFYDVMGESLRGPKGDKGDTGPQGPQGPPGVSTAEWEAALESNTSAIHARIDDEKTIRISADEAFAQRLQTVEADYTTQGEATSIAKALVTEESTARATADEAVAKRVTDVEAKYTQIAGDVSVTQANIRDEQTARADADEAMAQRIETVEASYITNADAKTIADAAVKVETTARATADEALASRLETIEADYTTQGNVDATVHAAVTDEATARADADGALASRIQTVEASYTTADDIANAVAPIKASVTDEAKARADADKAMASRIQTVEANYATHDDLTGLETSTAAKITDEATARADADSAAARRMSSLEATYGDTASAADSAALATSKAQIATEQATNASKSAADALASQTLSATYSSNAGKSAQAASGSAADAEGAATDAGKAQIASETSAKNSETFSAQADAARAKAETARDLSAQYQGKAAGSANDAAGYAGDASGSAEDAAGAAGAAAGSANGAAGSALAAKASATASETSRVQADAARSLAETARDLSASYRTEAGKSATDALGSKNAAAASATASDKSRAQADTARALAETARDLSANYRDSSQGYANNASGSANAAAGSAGAAAGSAADAGKAKTAAETAASNSETSRAQADAARALAETARALSARYASEAGSRAGRNIIARGTFDSSNSVGGWHGNCTSSLDPRVSLYVLWQRDRDLLEDPPVVGDWSSRILEISGNGAAWGPYHTNAGVRAVKRDGAFEYIGRVARTPGQDYGDFSFLVTLPANTVGIQGFLNSDGPWGASDHHAAWSRFRVEDVTEREQAKAAAAASETSRAQADAARALAETARDLSAAYRDSSAASSAEAGRQGQAASNRAGGNVVSLGAFTATSGVGGWGGKVSTGYASDIGQYVLGQLDRDSYDGEPVPGVWSNRRFRISGEVQTWGAYAAQVGLHCLLEDGNHAWIITGVAAARLWYTPFTAEIVLPANVKSARGLLVSDGPSGDSGHGLNWKSVRIEDITESYAAQSAASASETSRAQADAQRALAQQAATVAASYGGGGGNLLENSALPNKSTAGFLSGSTAGTLRYSVDAGGDDWRPVGEHVLSIVQGAGDGNYGEWLAYATVEAGKWYEASVYGGYHRCAGEFHAITLDAAGNPISTHSAGIAAPAPGGGKLLSGYTRSFHKFKAEDNCARVLIIMRKMSTVGNYSDSYAFFARPQVKEVNENAASPVPYSPADGRAVVEQTSQAVADAQGKLSAYWQVNAAVPGQRAQLTVYANNGGAGVDIVGNVAISGDLMVKGSIASGKVIRDTFVKVAGTGGSGNPGYGNKLLLGAVDLGVLPPNGVYTVEIVGGFYTDVGRQTMTQSGKPYYIDTVPDGGLQVVINKGSKNLVTRYNQAATYAGQTASTRYINAGNTTATTPTNDNTEENATLLVYAICGNSDTGQTNQGDYYLRTKSAYYDRFNATVNVRWTYF